jgi:hypothetical protein
MSVPQQVTRLSEDASTASELKQLLMASEFDGPSEQDLARFAARMAPLVGLAPTALQPGSVPRGTAPADLSPGTWGTAAAGKAGVAKLGGSLGAKLAIGALAVSVGLSALWAAKPAQPTVSTPAAPVAVESRHATQPLVPVQAEPAPELGVPAEAAPQAVSAPAPAATRKRSAVAGVAQPDELTLIAQAQALRGQGAALLRALAQHEKLYPQGMLAQEREVLAVEALIDMGKLTEAGRRADRLAAKYPASAHLPRLRGLLDKAAHE